MELTVLASGNGAKTSIDVSDEVFGAAYNPHLIHQVVTAYMAGARSGTKAQKSRGEVKGGGAKPWRQKGTGRARAGTSRSPIWRGGGVTFPARPRSYAQKVNKKAYRGAIRSILSELLRAERLVVVDQFDVDAPKCKVLLGGLDALGLRDVLIVVDAPTAELYLAARNLYHVDVRDADQVDPVSLLAFEHVLVTSKALQRIEERLA